MESLQLYKLSSYYAHLKNKNGDFSPVSVEMLRWLWDRFVWLITPPELQTKGPDENTQILLRADYTALPSEEK